MSRVMTAEDCQALQNWLEHKSAAWRYPLYLFWRYGDSDMGRASVLEYHSMPCTPAGYLVCDVSHLDLEMAKRTILLKLDDEGNPDQSRFDDPYLREQIRREGENAGQ